MDDLADVCASIIGTNRNAVLSIAKSAPYRFKKIFIPKRNGSGTRTIWQAAIETKGIHYSLIPAYLQKLPVHKASQAFSPGASIKKNALIHAKNRYILRIDLRDFFPSITFNSFKKIVVSTKGIFHEFDPTTIDSLFILERSCFDRSGRLPIGYATSPYIANCTMFAFDHDLERALVKKYGESNISYTRYADDLIFSTNEKGLSRRIYYDVIHFINRYSGVKLTVNNEKTHFGSVAAGSAYVTGTHILKPGKIAATKSLRSDARFLLSLAKRKTLKTEDRNRLRGLLAHLRHIDPAYYTKLATDFHTEFQAVTNN